MPRSLKYDTSDGRVYTGQNQSRRVVATFTHPTLGLRIVYSTGGEHNRECGYRTFRRWATAGKARKASSTRVPKFKLAGARA